MIFEDAGGASGRLSSVDCGQTLLARAQALGTREMLSRYRKMRGNPLGEELEGHQ